MLLLLSIAGTIILTSKSSSKISYVLLSITGGILSILNPVIYYSIKFQERRSLKRTAKISTVLLPFFIIGSYLLSIHTSFFDSDLSGIFLVIVLTLTSLFSLIYVFILREAGEIKGILTFILLIIISIISTRINFLISISEDFILPILVILTVAGMYMFGIRCLFILGKNNYLKIVTFFACLWTIIGGFAFLFKLLSGHADILELTYFIPAFLITLAVLLTLPISGYINWISVHKRILKKVLISWIFFLLVFSIRFVFPEYFKLIQIKEQKPAYEFLLNDYELQNKNGLKPE